MNYFGQSWTKKEQELSDVSCLRVQISACKGDDIYQE